MIFVQSMPLDESFPCHRALDTAIQETAELFESSPRGHRPAVVTNVLVVLIVGLAFIIVDLDRPRRGLIQVDQSSLTRLKAAIDSAEASDAGSQSSRSVPHPGAADR
jgi:hypothetical protein